MDAIEELVKLLSRLPGVGSKSASRITYKLINADPVYNQRLGEAIKTLQEKIHPCPICGSFTQTDTCPICSDVKRDHSIICVVSEPQDVLTIQSSGIYQGLFHVLNGTISPLNGIGPDQLRIKELQDRILHGNFNEMIIATNPNEEGDITALYLKRIFQNENIKITRIASGLPIGGDLEYADRRMLEMSLRSRMSM